MALAVLLLFGRKLWLGVWLAMFVSNLINRTPIALAFGSASGSAAMAYVSAYLLQEKVDFSPSFHRVRDVLNFVGIGVVLSPMISATVGATCFYFAGFVPAKDFLLDWFTWWVGDAMGVLIVAPVLLMWYRHPPRFINRRLLIEALALICLLILICGLVFGQGFGPRSFYPLAYLIFPLLIWAALRFDQRMVVSLMLLVAIVVVIMTANQLSSFSTGMIWNNLLFLWAYLATMAITTMLLAATFAERHHAEQTAKSLEERFSKAFHAAPVAIWIATLENGIFIDVNEEFCRMMNCTRGEVIGRSSLETKIWEYPEARLEMINVLRQKGQISQFQGRLRTESGEMRDGLISLELIELEGSPLLLGMFHDLTSRLRTEEALRDSERRYRQLFEGIDDAIFVHDMEANILDVNEATCRRLGYTRDELLTMKVTHLDTPTFASGFQERLKRQLEKGHLDQIEGMQITREGRTIFIDVNTKLINYKGKPAVLAVDRDITERKAAEQKLRESEARYRAIVEDQTEMICRLTPDWTLTFVNDAYCRYFGKSRDQLIGSQFKPNIHSDDYDAVARTVSTLRPENPVVVSEHRVVLTDGALRWHQLTDRAIFDDQGRVVEYQFVGSDITELKEMEKQRLAVALEHEKVQILADFIAAASHDFRTPLSVINTSAYLLNRMSDADQRDHHFKQIQEQTYHIERLVDGLLTMSRLDRGDVFRFKSVNLNSVIQQIEVRKRSQVDQKRQTLTLDLDLSLPAIEADEGWIYRCIVQFVDNAVLYTPDDGAITVRTECEPDRVIISIADTGVGITPEALPHIFKRLYRAEEHRPVGGQGLGLSIAAKIVEAHHGSIEVESEPGAGSTFRILLPLKRVDTSVEPSPSP